MQSTRQPDDARQQQEQSSALAHASSTRQPVRNRVDLHWALRTAQAERGISCEEIDAAALLASGHASKLLAPVPIRRIGPETMFPLVWALGKRLVIEDDPEAARTATAQ